MNERPQRSGPDSGFTLVEVLVALTILAIAMAVLLGILATGLDRQRRARDESDAMALARSVLAEAEGNAHLSPGDTTGQAPGGFTWRRTVAPYGSPDDREAWKTDAERITVTVAWANGT